MMKKRLTGTGVAIVTPFRNDRSIDFPSLGKLIDHIVEGRVNYVVVLGTTGESVTLSKDEKKAVVSFVLESVNGRIPVVIGIGGNNTQDVVDAISHFDCEGVSALLSVAPYYNKPSQNGIYMHYKAIVQVSPVPVILYNVPGRTGSNIAAETTVKLARDFRNIIAVKEASGNFSQIMQILKEKPDDFLVISGDDALTLPMISLGASGAISVIANAYPKEFSDIVNHALRNNFPEAAALQYKLLGMMSALFEEGSPSGIKAVLEILKIAQNHVRLPLVPVSEKHYRKLQGLVKALAE
ncbi:MAG: 4-hydroxy-tetrahydrodipicolinate synthase [Bacteroidales bacterium]|nr:4-hydroxy-tetrahydrodipicolinate synthase [Bacteroidales bacterium]